MIKFTTKSFELNFSLLLYLVINSLFIAKYISRLNINPFLPVLFFTIILIAAVFILHKVKIRLSVYKWLIITVILGIITGVLILQYAIDPYKLQVDRWSAIHNFLDFLFRGKYPYLAQTHLGGYGSPFPAWQIFHAPFYFVGNISLAFIFVLCLFIYVIYKNLKWSKQSLSIFIFFALSPAFWYEAAVRSDMMYNFILLLTFALHFRNKNFDFAKNIVILGIISGLFLSTRLAVVIPLFYVFCSDFFKINFRRKLIFITVITLTFVLTFTPFIVWNVNELLFFRYNPFILQTRQGSLLEIGLLLIMFLLLGNRTKNNYSNIYFYTSITLIIFVTATFFHRMLNENFANSLFSSSYDITYFNMAIPFLIYSISNQFSNQKTLIRG